MPTYLASHHDPPVARYDDAVALLLARLHALGFTDARREGDCVLCVVGTGTRTLYFSGHYDVVPAQRRDQFSGVVRDDAIVGRGSADMKAGLAAMIYATRALRDCDLLGGGRVGLVFVPDEETAGPRGSRDLASRGILGADGIGMLTPEPTEGVVWNANRGAISLRVTVRGKHAHVGRQHEGVNAFEGMLAIAQALVLLKREVECRRTSFSIEPDIARHGPGLLSVSHGPDELVSIDRVVECAQIYALTAADVFAS